MILAWTKSHLPLSVLIRAITGEDCSHFLFVFDNGLAFQSNLLGTNPVFWRPDKKKLTIVHQIYLPVVQQIEDHIWNVVIDKYAAKPYDYLGAIYLGYRILLKRFFKIPLPRKNKWHEKRAYYCDELFDCLRGTPGLPNLDVTGAMLTPHMVWERLSANPSR